MAKLPVSAADDERVDPLHGSPGKIGAEGLAPGRDPRPVRSGSRFNQRRP